MEASFYFLTPDGPRAFDAGDELRGPSVTGDCSYAPSHTRRSRITVQRSTPTSLWIELTLIPSSRR